MQSKSDRSGLPRAKPMFFFLSVVALAISGCTATRFLSPGESFYDGAKINIASVDKVGHKESIKKNLEEYCTPKPNTVILGSRPGVWFYYKAGNQKKGLRGWIKKTLGQQPVLLSDAVPDRIAKILTGQLYNQGYFKSEVHYSVETKNKKSTVLYAINLQPPYHLLNINYPQVKDSAYATIIRTQREKSLLKTGQQYNLERLQTEKLRIQENVHNNGFYYFDERYLLFHADSTVGKKQVDLDLTLVSRIPAKAERIYRLGQVDVITNYSLSVDSLKKTVDTLQVNGFRYVENTENRFKPEVITEVINLKQGDVYTQDARDLTLSHLTGLGTFKFVNVKFRDSPTDSALLNASIYLTPSLRKSIRMEFQVTSKSNNFVGPGFSVTFTNRNFLRGAELFQLKLNTGYEAQISRQQAGALNSFELGVEASLAVHRFITPIPISYHSKKYLPQTIFKVGYTIQQRIDYFKLNSITGGFGYTWRESTSKTHVFYPIDINYVQLSNTSLKFDAIESKNPFLIKAFENQFIPGMRYSFTLNTQLKEPTTSKFSETRVSSSNFYFNGNLELAGNLLHFVQSKVRNSDASPYTLLGSPYSQYVRTDLDFRYYRQIDHHNKLAMRLLAGLGYPFGNSVTLPYIKQFSIGGSNSIRAFPARSIGPGTYNVRSDTAVHTKTFFIDQRGDIKLEGNIEYRFDLIKAMKGALFLDAGNIWLLNNEIGTDGKIIRPGAKFKSDTFLNDVVAGTGFGLRFDFNFFVLRFDLGIPIRRPLPQNNGTNKMDWVLSTIDFGSSRWRNDNLLFNIAIGYPF